MSKVRALWQASLTATKRALTWNIEDLIPPSERFIYNFNSKEELKKWHLYSDSEYGGLSSAALEITDAGNGQSGPGVFSGNLSLDVTEGTKWNISRSGFCGMRSKKCHKFFSTTASGNLQEENEEKQKISVTFFDKDGEQEIKVPIGMSMLEAAHENDIELEGACEGSLACSTCHVIVMDVEQYNKLEEPTDEENDMLDLAFGLTETSRLGCQVIAKPELDGLRLALPAATRNFAVDGYKPKPH